VTGLPEPIATLRQYRRVVFDLRSFFDALGSGQAPLQAFSDLHQEQHL
jgi:hypothetical protein